MSSTSGLLGLVEEHQIILENPHLHLGFSRTEAGVWYLASLRRTIAGSKEWIKVGTEPLPLWQMRFLHESYLPPDASSRNRWDMRVQQEWLNVDASAPARTAATVERQSEQVVLTILWEGIVLAGADETADVRVTVSLAADSEVSRWSAQVRTQGTHSSLWELRYPLIGDLVASEETTLIVPAGWGMGIEGAAQKADVYDGYYPSGGV